MDAFETLLAKKNYNKITVQEIIDAADVGRTTFYAHFDTKDALLEEMCTDFFTHVFSQNPCIETTHDFSLSEGDFETIICHMLYHINDNGKNISRLLTGESSGIFLHYFNRYLNQLVQTYVTSRMNQKNRNIPEDFLQNHVSGSFVNMVQWWINGGMKESPEQMTEYFLSVIVPVV